MNIKQILAEDGSFSGGRVLPSALFGGVVLASGVSRYDQIFSVSVNDTSNANAKLLSNMANPGKLGATEKFWALQYGIQIQKYTAGKPTEADVNNIIQFINASRLEIFVGDSDQRVLDIPLCRFGNVFGFQTGPTTAGDGVGLSVPFNTSRWLQVPAIMGGKEEFPPNTNFRAQVTCGLSGGTPAVTATTYILNVIIEGLRFVRT